MKTAYDIIIKPVITEQSMEQTEAKKGVTSGRRANWKKAMVKLTADSKTIEFFEGMV